MDAQTRASVLARAREWINTPYVHNARKMGIGVDCGHLVHDVYSVGAGMLLRPMPKNYAADWTMHENSTELYLDFIQEYVHEIVEPVVAGLVVFQVGRRFGHAGIVSDKGVIHAWGRTQFGSVQEKPWPFFAKWQRKFFDVRA